MTNNTQDFLYHYTTLDNAIKIVATNTLLFGRMENLNDINESYRNIFGKFNMITKADNILHKYQRLSFVIDKPYQKGYCIPSMWGHYAESGNGACLVFNKKSLLNCLSSKMASDYVTYSCDFDNSITLDDEGNINSFFKKYKHELFYTKTKDWEHEQEFRVIQYFNRNYRARLNLRNSLYAIILHYAADVIKGETVFNSINVDIFKRINRNVKILELGNWLGNVNLRDCEGNEIEY